MEYWTNSKTKKEYARDRWLLIDYLQKQAIKRNFGQSFWWNLSDVLGKMFNGGNLLIKTRITDRVGEGGHELLWYSVVMPGWEGMGEILFLEVNTKYQKQGFGREAVEESEKFMVFIKEPYGKAEQIKGFKVYSPVTLRVSPFWIKMGYKPCHDHGHFYKEYKKE